MKFSQDLKQIKSNYQFKLRTILDFINEIDVYIEKILMKLKELSLLLMPILNQKEKN